MLHYKHYLETCCALVSHFSGRITDLFRFTSGTRHPIIKGNRACKIFKTNKQMGFLYYLCIILKIEFSCRVCWIKDYNSNKDNSDSYIWKSFRLLISDLKLKFLVENPLQETLKSITLV